MAQLDVNNNKLAAKKRNEPKSVRTQVLKPKMKIQISDKKLRTHS